MEPKDIVRRKLSVNAENSQHFGLRHSSSLPNIMIHGTESSTPSSIKPSYQRHSVAADPTEFAALDAEPASSSSSSSSYSISEHLETTDFFYPAQSSYSQPSLTPATPTLLPARSLSIDLTSHPSSTNNNVTCKRASSSEILASLPINLIHQWILAFAVVNFDLEQGPTLDCLYPDVELSKDEKTTM
jgi:hypothetical protein